MAQLTVHYRMATMAPDQAGATSEAAAWLPALAERNGTLTIEHGFHQEIAWERQTDASGMSVVLFSDHIDNPVLEALGHFAPGDAPAAVLFDRASNLMRAAGPAYSAAGVAGQPGAPAARRQSRAPELCQRRCPGDAGTAAGTLL